jgi:hypothetical protein
MSALESAKGGIRIRHRLGSSFVQEVETFGFVCIDAIAKCLAVRRVRLLDRFQDEPGALASAPIRLNEESRRQSASDRAGDNREYSVEEVPQSGDVAHFDPETTAASGFFPAFCGHVSVLAFHGFAPDSRVARAVEKSV